MKYLFFITTLFLFFEGNSQTLEWARDLKGGSESRPKCMTVDANGNSYIIGSFKGTVDFDPGPGVHNLTASYSPGGQYLLKLNSLGEFQWVNEYKGYAYPGDIKLERIICDESGAIYIAGSFNDTIDFDADSLGVTELSTASNGYDGFLLKLNSDGELIWVKQFANTGSGMSEAKWLALDNAGGIYLSGNYLNTVDFDPGTGIDLLATTGTKGVFIVKLDTSGTYQWSNGYGSPGANSDDEAFDIATDMAGNLYSSCRINANTWDIFDSIAIRKLGSAGNIYWTKFVKYGINDNNVFDIATDNACNVYLAGSFGGTVDFDPGAGTNNLTAGGLDTYIQKLDSSGNFLWAGNFKGTEYKEPGALAIDGDNNVYVTGYFQGTADFDPGAGVYNLQATYNMTNLPDIYLAKLSQNGDLISAINIGGAQNDKGTTLALDAGIGVYIAGTFKDTVDFDPGVGVYNLVDSSLITGSSYIAKLSWPTSIHPVKQSAYFTVNIYPNPAKDELTISTDGQYRSYTISNSIGQVLLQQTVNGTESEADIKSLAPGVYYISLKGEQGTEVRKFVKM